MTSPETFQRAEALFNLLTDAPAEERSALLQAHAGEDAELRELLERMLAREEAGEDLSAIGQVFGIADAADEYGAGDRVGAYRIERKLGEGGMGIVYEADQAEPVARRVALKLIKLGMDSAQILARFETERKLLARMQHPNIAVLYDAGRTGNGRPYFAMEYVDGMPIVHYCDEQRMPVAERLRLVLQVCNGVQHAHQKGVIHRDLKPTNIHVYTDSKGPRAKIIDFGIARLVDPGAGESMTRIGQVVGTPEYMSPEQLAPDASDIDTRTDVYALGMILFELLTGSLPARRAQPGSARKPSDHLRSQSRAGAIAGKRNTTPTRLYRTLAGDLDWIVMRATHVDRDRRYGSAAELAQDICRYLDGEPVVAGPDSRWYRFRKLVGRNRGLAVASGVAMASLVAAAVTSTYFAIDAMRARDAAQRETEVAQAVVGFLNQDILAQGNPYENSNRELTLREAVGRAADSLEARFPGQPEVKAAIYMALGDTYAGLYQTPNSLDAYERAVNLLDAADIRSEAYFTALLKLAGEQVLSGRNAEADRNLQGLRAADPSVLPADHPVRLQAMNTLAMLYDNQGEDDAAIAIYEEAVAAHRRVFGEDHRETLTVMNNLALTYGEVGDNDRASVLLNEVAGARERTLGRDDPDTILSQLSLGYTLKELGDLERAERTFLSTLETGRRVLGEEHPMYLYGFYLLADVYQAQGKYADAERLFREALNGHLSTLGSSHTLTRSIQASYAALLAEQERYDEAAPMFEEVVRYRMEAMGAEKTETLEAVAALIECLDATGRCDEAADWSGRFLPAARAAFEAGDDTLATIRMAGGSCR